MARFVKEGDSFLNVGSHVGLEAAVIGKIVGNTSGKLYIFEPFSLSYNIMLKNVYLNNLEDIAHTYNLGGSDKKSKGYLAVSKANTGGSEIFSTV